ncbi:MAG: hypothetical protein AAGC68_05050 [Verrucomicrobiota bacterium]
MTMRILSVILPFSAMLVSSSCRTLGGNDTPAMTETAFVTADLNSDGRLTDHELATHKHREALAELDLDNDSHISAGEWATARQAEIGDDPHFNTLDKDGNGSVSEDEAVQFITQHVSFGSAFRRLDQNGDFHLHWEEIDEAAPDEINVTLFSLHPDEKKGLLP